MLEKEVENYFNVKVREHGGIPYKFTSPGRSGVTDRIAVFPFRIIVFVELKRPGKKPRPSQWREMARVKRRDHYVVFIDCKSRVDVFIEWVKKLMQTKKKRGTYRYGNKIGMENYRRNKCYRSAAKERIHYKRKQPQSAICGGSKSGIQSFQKILHAKDSNPKNKRKE